MEEQLRRIESAPGVGGIALWTHHSGKFVGCLLDEEEMDPIGGSTVWNPMPTIQDVLDSLERAAATLQAQAATRVIERSEAGNA